MISLANNTPNLELYKVDPITDGDKTFNVTTMLNENWDKIDRAAAEWGNAKILAPKAFTATDEGDRYPLGVSMFYLDADGMQSGWPFNNGQVLTFVTGKNRVSQMVFETNIATQRIWTRRWSSTQKAWSDFLEQETTAGSAEKVVQALKEAKAYTNEKTATIDAPVKSVNGKTGDVVLAAADVGAAPTEHNHDASAIISGTIAAARLPSASTGAKGIVQLSDALNSTSTSHAATANAVKKAYDEALAAKQSGVDAKNRIVGAISAKGVPASANDTWPTLETKIRQINTGGRTDLSFSYEGELREEKTITIFTFPAGTQYAMFYGVESNRNGINARAQTDTSNSTASSHLCLSNKSNRRWVILGAGASGRYGKGYEGAESLKFDFKSGTVTMHYRRYETGTEYTDVKSMVIPSYIDSSGPINLTCYTMSDWGKPSLSVYGTIVYY